jgi:hypothetical protein
VPPELADTVADYLWLPQYSPRRKLVVKDGEPGPAAHPELGGVTAGVMCSGRALIRRGWRISSIRHRTGNYCGLQLTYRHPTDTEQTFTMAVHAAPEWDSMHHGPQDGCFELQERERIRQVTMRHSMSFRWLICVTVDTSLGRRCEVGASEELMRGTGQLGLYSQLIPAADVMHCEVLAFQTGMGSDSHILHSLGVYYHTLPSDA